MKDLKSNKRKRTKTKKEKYNEESLGKRDPTPLSLISKHVKEPESSLGSTEAVEAER